ncbi:MAG: hypothetical protein H0V82_08535 [Candidatus Protochlamydia sp.]|nr:hypothetical protein [Candidatus Protochlamydia sp.]
MRFLILAMITYTSLLEGHEGHSSSTGENLIDWILKIGGLHLVFLHFPIALITMTVLAEILNIRYKNPLYENAARFMLISAAVLTPLTALLGFALGFGQFYEGTMNDIYSWHRYFGIVTTILVLWAVRLRENYFTGKALHLRSYYICLLFLFISLNLTGLLGGALAFG